jgi:hypothetical protein
MNIVAILTVADRLAPFILISFFVGQSLTQGDARGVLFLGMMLVNCFLTIAIGNVLGEYFHNNNHSPDKNKCSQMNLTQDGPLSKYFPLNVNVFSFTLGYILEMYNQGDDKSLGPRTYPLVALLLIYVAYQCIYLNKYRCNSLLNILSSSLLGITLGALSALMLYKSDLTEIQFFSNISGQDVCNMNNSVSFSCSNNP